MRPCADAREERTMAGTSSPPEAEPAGFAGKPIPLPDEITAPFWEATRQGRLAIQRCPACGFYIHAPQVVCPRCGNEALEVRDVSGRGTVYSFTVVRESATRGFEPPYLIGFVELEEQPGLIYLTNLVEVEP